MGKENIENFSAGYALLKSAAGFWHKNVFYRKTIVIGRENINPVDTIIFAPNHQNALMDALAVLFTHKGQPVFLARSDIFKSKAIASILYFLKILPVYRIRDGFSSLKGNDEIFGKTIDVLKNKNGLIILPEGDHAGFRRLRQLKKGICRIAFQAEEASGYNLNLKIIPVGIEFSNYTRFRQVLTVVYGKPFGISEYFGIYRENPEKALNELRTRISDEIKKVMIHIDSVDDYDAIDELRAIINGKYSDDIKNPKIFRDRKLIDKLNKVKADRPQIFERICSLSLHVKKRVKDLNLTYRLMEKKKHPLGWLLAGLISLIIMLPVYIFGNVFNLTFLSIPNLQIPKIKDPQFHSSIRFGLSFALAFIFLPVYLILCLLLFSPWWVGLLIFITLPLSGLIAWNYYLLFGRIMGGFRIRKLMKKKDRRFIALRRDYNELIKLINQISHEEK